MFPGVSASHFLTASLFLNIAFLHLLSNTSCLSFLTPPITTVDTSPHRFMSLKHQPAESYNSSSASHYSSCSFACYTDLGKLVGQRSLKLHKAALFLSLQFNQNRHSSNANPQLNFLQAKCWGIKKKKRGMITASIYDKQLISGQDFASASLLIWSARSHSPKSVLLKSWYTI